MPFKDPIAEKEYQKKYRDLHRDKRLKYFKNYYQVNRQQLREYGKQYFKEHREETIKRSKEYRVNNRAKVRLYKNKRLQIPEVRGAHNSCIRKGRLKAKNLCLNHYSNGKMECAHCKEKIITFLTIDHMYGGGSKHKKQTSNHLYQWLVRNNFPEGFQILCWNCNCSRERLCVDIRKRKYRQKQKLLCIEHYSNGKNECECCHEKTLRYLTIDHIEGNGRKHRKEICGNHITVWLVRNKFPHGYRILCWNCNSSVKQNGICPHKLPDIKVNNK